MARTRDFDAVAQSLVVDKDQILAQILKHALAYHLCNLHVVFITMGVAANILEQALQIAEFQRMPFSGTRVKSYQAPSTTCTS
jgi:hypothetical protein